jgi:conjugative transfer region protein TrbK
MNSKLFARVGAGAFVAIAITMAVLELREEPAPPQAEIITVSDEPSDGAKATLAYCAELGLEAASVDICTEAWAAERRRFLGQAERDASELEASSEVAPTDDSDPANPIAKDR